MTGHRSLVIAAALGGLLALDAAPAAAQNGACRQRDALVGHLKSRYGEELRGAGMNSSDGILELYVSDTGSWTLLLTRPNGTSCAVAVGNHWISAPEDGEPEGDPV